MGQRKKVVPKGVPEDLRERVNVAISGGSFSALQETATLLDSLEDKLSPLKNWNFQVLLRLQLLKTIQERLSGKEEEAEGVAKVGLHNVDKLLAFPAQFEGNNGVGEKQFSELYARLSFFGCQIGFRFQKRKMFTEALAFCERAMRAYRLWEAGGRMFKDLKLNTQWLCFLKAECLKNLDRAEEGLRWLAKELVTDPSYWEQPSLCYDVFEQIPWSDFSTHWMALYKDVWVADLKFAKCTLDYLKEDEILPKQVTISRVLRLELNAHFATRHGVPAGIISVGEALLERSGSHLDNLLGFLAVAIGKSFGSKEDVESSVEAVLQCVEFIETEEFFKRERNSDAAAFLSSLVSIWRGLCILKSLQYFVEDELGCLRQQFLLENPEKYRDRDTGEEIRGVSAFSSLTLDHEKDWVCSLVHGIEVLFRFSESEKVMKAFCNEYCPALVLMSCRLSASLLVAVGDTLNGAKAWYIVYRLAKIYDKKGTIVLSASEILKLIPDLDGEVVSTAEAACDAAVSGNIIKHNKAVSRRLSLSKAIACYNLKNYSEGASHLLDVFKYLEDKDNFDATHHLLGDATYVLSWYRMIQVSHSIDLSGFPESLVKMSPAGISVKAFKLLGGMMREPDTLNSGWTDMVHNYYLLSSLLDVGSHTLKLLREAGKTKELKCFLSDLIAFAQHAGFVSRSISMLVPMISIDISSRNLIHAQIKIDAVNRVFSTSICPEETDDANPETYAQLLDNFKLPLTVKRLECMNDLKWNLKSLLEIPSLYYRNRSEKFVTAAKKDIRDDFSNTAFRFPQWMRHNLSCSCYVCWHPQILPTALEFIHAQAKYANAMSKAKSAMAILETAKLCHERIIFRVIYNLGLVAVPLYALGRKNAVMKAAENLYTPFCVTPGIDSLMAQMIICPTTDIKLILSGMKKAKQIIETLDPKDFIGKAFPLEAGYSALYRYLTITEQVTIEGSSLRANLEEKMNAGRRTKSTAPDSPLVSTPPTVKEVVCPGPPRKGILKTRHATVNHT